MYVLWEGPTLSWMCNLVEHVVITTKLLNDEPFWLFSSFFKIYCKVEVGVLPVPVQAFKVCVCVCVCGRRGGQWRYISLHSSFRHYVTMSGQLHTSSAISPGTSHRYPLDRRVDVPQSCFDALETRNLLLLPGIGLRSLDCPAHT
jgi:hypothetical protein